VSEVDDKYNPEQKTVTVHAADDGTEDEFGPGDTAIVLPGHNAWTVGNEPCVAIDFTGAKEYARGSR
jgi:hypothetical protein